jgi:hypothetical protein
MKLLVNSLFYSLEGIFNLLIIIILLWYLPNIPRIMISILFMNLFSELSGFCDSLPYYPAYEINIE